MVIADWMKELTPEQLVEPYKKIATSIGVENTIHLASMFQGTPLYFPKFDGSIYELRNQRIREEFNGSNHKELALKYDLTERWIYEIVSSTADENQISFFERNS